MPSISQPFRLCVAFCLLAGALGCSSATNSTTSSAPVDGLVEVTASNFRTLVLENPQCVLLVFSGENCPPCRQMEPFVKKLANLHQDKLLVGHVQLENQQSLANEFQVKVVPTLIVFQKGKVKARDTGGRSLAELENFIAPFVAKAL